MKALFALCAAGLLAAGCASTGNENMKVAQNCKVQPMQTATAASNGKSVKPVDSLRQREAEMDLARTDYRMAQLQRNGMFNNTVEEALRDCR